MAMDSRIRVLHLGSPTGLYGAERWILALVNNMDRARVDSIVAVIRDDPKLGADLCAEAGRQGFRTHVFEAHGKVNWSAVRMLNGYLQAERIDVLHTHGYKTDVIGLLAARGTSCKLVSTPHGWSKQAGFKLRLYEALDRRVFCHLHAVVPLSQELFDDLATRLCLRGKLHLIPNGVDLSDVRRPVAIAPEIATWKAEGRFVFGYIGQLIKRKGLDVLLQALAGSSGENWRLALVGEGDERGTLEAQAGALRIGDQVRFFGFREDRMAFLKGFDAFVLPSRLEGIPRCLMESMAAGVATIASDIPGCRDLIAHGGSGLLFVPDSVAELRGALQEVARDETLRSRLAAAGQRTIEENWSAEIMAKRYGALYAELINCKKVASHRCADNEVHPRQADRIRLTERERVADGSPVDGKRKSPFVVFSDDWGEHPSSCQHLFKRIAKDFPVVWVNTVGMRHPRLTLADARKAYRKLRRMLSGLSKPQGGQSEVTVLQPPMLPYAGLRIVQDLNRQSVVRAVRGALDRLGLSSPIVVTTVPNAADVVGSIGGARIVYYCVDDFAHWPGMDSDRVRRMEEQLIFQADLFIATSQKLLERLRATGKQSYLLEHGVDVDFFATEAEVEHHALAAIPKPRVGYIGLIDERLDQDLLIEVASRMAHVSFVLAGPFVIDVNRLRRLSNVFFTGAIPYRELPSLIKGFATLLLPYVCNTLSESISPLKLKEYLATGKSVVSTPLLEVSAMKPHVLIGSSPEQIAGALEVGIASGDSKPQRELLLKHDWNIKAQQFVSMCMSGR